MFIYFELRIKINLRIVKNVYIRKHCFNERLNNNYKDCKTSF